MLRTPTGAVTTLTRLMRIQEYFTIFSCITQAQEENIYEH
nr:MAG TPA: hypothetical protein [Caudoviricetes sp.]